MRCSAQVDQTAIRIKCRHRDRSVGPRSSTWARGQATRGTPFCMDKIRSGGLLLRSASLIAAKRSCSARCQAAPSFRILEPVDAPAWLSLPRTPFLKLIARLLSHYPRARRSSVNQSSITIRNNTNLLQFQASASQSLSRREAYTPTVWKLDIAPDR
jgi:hypothetical protein